MKLTLALLTVACGICPSLLGQMTPQYSYYQNFSYSPTTRRFYSAVTTSGNSTYPPSCGSQCSSAFHYPQGTNRIKLHGVVVAESVYNDGVHRVSPPTQQINYTNTISADWSGCDIAGANDCVGTGEGSQGVFCSVAGLFSNSPFHFQVEAALTRADWLGAPPPVCSGNPASCRYATVNNCTPETMPPDLNVIAVDSGDYRGSATYLSWMNVAPCIRLLQGQPWVCSAAFSQLQGINGAPYPPFACTRNP